MSKQTYTTGQVLTSAQMTQLQTNDYNQTVSAKVASYVLVASDAGTRITMANASATTITVNTALFTAGDTLTITNISTGVCTITAGTATVSTAGSLALQQYDSGTLYFTSTGVSIWNGANPGDITGVTAGTGISGGGTSGTVTVTNSMATAITTNGDIIYGTGSGTFSRLGIGSSAQVLSVSSGIPAWSTPSTGAVTQITTGTFTAVTSKSVDSCFTSTYKNYSVIIQCATDAGTGTAVTFRYRASAADLTANSYYGGYYRIIQNGTTSTTYSNPATSVGISFVNSIANTGGSTINLTFNDPLAAGYGHPAVGTYFDSSQSNVPATIGFEYLGSGTPDGFTILCANAFSGSYKIYGWSN